MITVISGWNRPLDVFLCPEKLVRTFTEKLIERLLAQIATVKDVDAFIVNYSD